MRRRSVLGKQSVKKRPRRRALGLLNAFRAVGSVFLKAFLTLSAVAAVSLSFLFLYHYLLDSPYLRLEQAKVEGVDRQIRTELIRMGGLNQEVSLLSLNLNLLKKKMEKHPWVRSVRLERRFPHTLYIRAEQEIPLALVLRDKPYYMNRWGEIFKEVAAGDDLDYPIITGLSETDELDREELDKAKQVMEVLVSEAAPWSLSGLSEIHLKRGRGVSLYFSHLDAEIKLACDDVAAKIAGLKKVIAHLNRLGRMGQVVSIDLNSADGAVVSFRNGDMSSSSVQASGAWSDTRSGV